MIKLQNLCFPDPEICSVKELYVHETEDTLLLDGFFNLLYLEKRIRYIGISMQELITLITTTTIAVRMSALPIFSYWGAISGMPVTGCIAALMRFLKCWPNGSISEGCLG